MPWEITIVNADANQPLGAREAVTAWLSEALPGVEFGRPASPPDEFFDWMPAEMRESVRKAFAAPRLKAAYEADDLVIDFSCTDEDPIRFVSAEVRGQGSPLPALARICLPRGWVVISDADRSPVDLTQEVSDQWEHFCNWRDKAVANFQDEEPI